MIRILLLLVICCVAVVATTYHRVNLSWQDTENPVGTTYNVYKAYGLCQANYPFSIEATGVGTLTYSEIVTNTYNHCYYVTAVVNGVESAPSNTVSAVTKF